ncbi:spliceosome-associated CWC15 family protein [Abyssalbus ytuae]|uniref:Spliceosome-associated CWC15 family protein n=1 Tax=Abyssalbus ytuae TaxID=2926907 RepID=A0A9E6ZJG2_9FLAO|nr:spliceosome-associated CWC15 family protein [Abyssalbus ytuae]UOB16697.1 spliceosome-associated CWC15 family protein [Abyssalbus ytuae]
MQRLKIVIACMVLLLIGFCAGQYSYYQQKENDLKEIVRELEKIRKEIENKRVERKNAVSLLNVYD